MAKRYDPILCMMVDEPTKAQDAMPSDLKKAGYEVGTVEKYGSTYYTLVYNGKVISTSPTEANIVEKAKKHYANRHAKAHDELLFYQLRFSSGRTEGAKLDESEIRSYAEALLEKYGEKQVAVSRQGKIVATYLNRKAYDSASALDEAIKTADGMFSKAFGEYSKGAKFKKDKFLKELAGIEDAKEFASKMQTFDNELRKNLERLDEAYNVAGQDYYSARNEIRSIMDAFSKEAFGLYRKLDTK